MQDIPPVGGTPDFPAPNDPSQIAKELRTSTGQFVEQTYDFLKSPHLADNPSNLEQFAKTILKLHQDALQALGK